MKMHFIVALKRYIAQYTEYIGNAYLSISDTYVNLIFSFPNTIRNSYLVAIKYVILKKKKQIKNGRK